MAENIVNKSDNLEELIKDQSNRIGELETHIENMSELFDQKEQTLATELLKMRLLMSEFVKFHCCPKNITSNNSIFPLSTEEKRSICGKEQSCNTINESNSLIVSKVCMFI
uniref:Uncharacterized protein n=1 Tax=Panagrolaimus sp. PS1159 TaxID=55785 RepID=A0AC35GVF0_9BILA